MDLFTLVGKIAIDCTEAETKINSLLEKAGQLSTALGGSSSTDSTSAGTTSTGTTSSANTEANKKTSFISSTLNTALTVASGFAFKFAQSINSTGTEMLSTMEDAAASFKTKLGVTYEEGYAFAEELRDFAKETPLSLSSVLSSADQLLSAGVAKEDVIDMLTVIGNNVNGDDSKLYRATKFVTDVKGYDQLNAQEKRQAVENGIYIDRLLEDYFFGGENVTGDALKAGFEKLAKEVPELITEDMLSDFSSSSEVMDFISGQHGFDFEDMWNALVYAQEYGNFTNAMENRMGTYSGVSEKFGDSFSQYAEAIVGESGFASLKKSFMQLLTNVMDSETERLQDGNWFYWKEIPENLKRLYHELGFGVGSSSPTEEEYAEEMRQRYEDRYGTPPPADWDWNVGSSTENSADTFANTIATKVAEAVANEIPAAIASGMSNVTITTGNVTLNDGVLVGRLLPRINTGLGQLALRDLRG